MISKSPYMVATVSGDHIVGNDNGSNAAPASSLVVDSPVAKISQNIPVSSVATTCYQYPNYENQCMILQNNLSDHIIANPALSNVTKTLTSANVDSTTFVNSSQSGFETPLPNPFINPSSFEPSVVPYKFSKTVESTDFSAQANTFTSLSTTFPSPGSAFTELHPKTVKSQSVLQPGPANPHSESSSSHSTTNLYPTKSQNEVNSDVNAKSLPCLCRCCGQSHDATSAHLYNYTQAVDADLCCTLCRQPLVDPLDTKCGHTFCSPCLKNHLAVQALCPVDKQIINYLECQQASNIVKRLLDKLLVGCPNAQFCDMVVYRSNLEDHLRNWCVGPRALNDKIEKSNLNRSSKTVTQWGNTYRADPGNQTTVFDSAPDSRCSVTVGSQANFKTRDTELFRVHRHHQHQQQRQPSELNSQSTNFGLNFPQHYLKEFPHLFSSFRGHEQQGSDKAEFTESLPIMENNIDCAALHEGAPVSISISRQSDCVDLGFTFVGGVDTPLACILIQEIYLDGPVALDGRLRPGDQLLEVNGNLLTHATHAEARCLLSNTSPVIQLTIFREPVSLIVQQHPSTQYHQEIFYVKLCKRQGKVLGIKLVGKKHLPGLYILELVAGCEADLDGRMKKDDQILEINGIDLSNGTQEQAAQIINSVSDSVIFKISRCNRADTPDILRTTSVDFDDKLDTNLLTLESLQFTASDMQIKSDHGQGWSSVEADPSLSNAQSTTELIRSSSDRKSPCSSDDTNCSPQIVNRDGKSNFTSESRPSSHRYNVPPKVPNVAEVPSPTVENTNAALSKQFLPSLNEFSCQEKTVSITKAPEEPLGISIAGGRHSQRGDTPIYITNISPDSVSGRSKQMRRGDLVLEANGVALIGLTHQEAVEVLRQISALQTRVLLNLITAPETTDGPENFMPSWTYWLRLPPICQLSRAIRLRRGDASSQSNYSSTYVQQPLGFSIVGGLGHDRGSSINSMCVPSELLVSASNSSNNTTSSSNSEQKKVKNKHTNKYNSVSDTNLYPCPIVIKSIVPGLLAHKDGRLKCGDIILAVNNISMLNISHLSAVQLLKQTQGDVVLQVVSWPGTIV